MRKKLLMIPLFVLALLILQAPSAFACGGLIAPDGDVRLQNAATLVAWHDGIEHYLTSFSYQGEASNVGWIVPLPAVPLKIEAGGAWTLQRLFRETHPIVDDGPFALQAASPSAQVLQQVQVEALNITVVRGSGDEVVTWAYHNGFYLDNDTREHLLTYAKGSPIFMAAKYDTSAAKARHQITGDGVPLLITMKTAHPWIPLEVLALDGQQVQADLYLLTDMPVYTSDLTAKIGQSSVNSNIPGASGFTVAAQEQLSDQLYHDLSTDRNMSWVRKDSWLTYLSLNAPSSTVTYDMGVSKSGVIRLAPFGTAPMAVVDGQIARANELPAWLPALPLGTPEVTLLLVAILSVVAIAIRFVRKRRRAHMTQTTA
ncbi:MAG TPA: DUF2330 domain-containing protein [Ktedonobacteraceae bacterium]|nr:DUF2330 domain-containing protein [Ktedonobacteraceae bacterium]